MDKSKFKVMIKWPLLFILCHCVISLSWGQTPCLLKDHYKDFISIQARENNGNKYLLRKINTPKESECFYDLINNNQTELDYLLVNFNPNYNKEQLLSSKDSLSLTKTYLEELRKDTIFSSLMQELGYKTIDNSQAKDTITMNQMMDIAVKFFSIIRLTEEGYYVGKICVGINDIKATEDKRLPFVEAFCFSAILHHYNDKKYNMNHEFTEAILSLYKVKMGINKKEKLLRAQGAIFMMMRNNKALFAMLKEVYESKKIYLPFILVGQDE